MGPAGSGWDRVFFDDFSNASLPGWEKQVAPSGRAGNIYVQNDELVIEINASGHPSGITWGAIGTGSLRFGPGSWFECRAKQPAGGKGCWTAFWLSCSDTSGGASAGGEGYGQSSHEFDIFEYLHTSLASAGHNYYTLHTWQPTHTQNQTIVDHGIDLSQDYHTYSLYWGDSAVEWYMDGTLVKRETTGFFEKACRLIFQSQTDYADNWPGPVDGTTTHPHYFRIQWVGVWQQAPWHGYQRVRYSPGGLTAGQQTEFLNALTRQYRSTTNTSPFLRTQVKLKAAQDWIVELSGEAAPSTSDWTDVLYSQITGMDRATLAANLIVDTASGADFEARRLAAKALGW